MTGGAGDSEMMKRVLVVAMVAGLAGCSLEQQAAPSFIGPSELGLSLAVSVTPDILTQDGVSRATVQVIARDPASQPIAGVMLRAETVVGGVPVDFGQLSSRTISTGADGRAVLTYLAPPPPPPTVTSDTLIVINITPVGSNFDNSLTRSVSLRLSRPGIILPPDGKPVPRFFFSPTQPKEHETVLFDGSLSADDGQIVSYVWNFGDGATAIGVRPTHRFDLAGTYNVVLTVTDDKGQSASSTPVPVAVGVAVKPTAKFVFSPTDPQAGVTTVFFNAAESVPSPGFQLVGFSWDFGDGASASGSHQANHLYTAPGTYTVVLTVIDSSGQEASVSVTVTVGT